MKTTEYRCDIKNCSEVVPEDDGHIKKKISVIFHTEQTEGRPRAPYLTIESIDICESCLDKILSGNMLHGSGAQGNNTYYFKKPTSTEKED